MGSVLTRREAQRSLNGWLSPLSVVGAPYLSTRPPAVREALTARSGPLAVLQPEADEPRAHGASRVVGPIDPILSATGSLFLIIPQSREENGKKPIMILPQVHLRKPCYDFYFL